MLKIMSPKLDGPVQVQMVVDMLSNSPSSGNCHGNKSTEGKLSLPPSPRRRIFVQTERGHVLGMELDRRDNASMVKKRLQLALDVPTDGSSLTFGDMILNNDLTAVRKDCPLLLTRNMMHRSSSTPCLSPTGKADQLRDKSGIVEILGQSNCFGRTSKVVKEIVRAIKSGVDPIPVNSGLGGVYYFRNCKGESVAIVKPTDEEPFAPNNPKGFSGKSLGQPGLKWSVRVGETGYREVAAYLLDYDHYANVPPTALVKVSHSVFNVNDCVNGNKLHNMGVVSKIASLQHFVRHDFDASDLGTTSFPVSAVHRIGILDVRIFNTDRHAGNLLVRKLDGVGKFGQVELIPIDHGLCLPEGLEDPYFEWMHWPQASIPFSEEELEYIRNLDPIRDCEMLRAELPMMREACLKMLVLSTTFLKEATKFGLCLAEIGEMMSREYSGHGEEPSELESVCLEARRTLREASLPIDNELRDQEYQFDMDNEDTSLCQEIQEDLPPKLPSLLQRNSVNGLNAVSKLQFLGKEDAEIHDERTCTDYSGHELDLNYFSNAVKLSKSLKRIDLVKSSGQKPKLACLAGTTCAQRRSGNELLPITTGFVNSADLSEEEWILFLSKFQELLGAAFANRKSSSIALKQRQRQGTSREF
ncbi:phosphatidylinositol 4-kinase gamma 7-like [Coffea arabica]|uniref:1-phosphatidylinositol 4-kinase n=1 Tax=Coffea arabica TaxID=13443 RepID=A0A6P6X875_COFAR|nr:phosphatidylinositol 4-kinase gamma 7-like [Coffea arabica]XP_027123555.1 phosphatidylinositol 4-kinase gamma 7-like [Coffea arabica]